MKHERDNPFVLGLISIFITQGVTLRLSSSNLNAWFIRETTQSESDLVGLTSLLVVISLDGDVSTLITQYQVSLFFVWLRMR
jgi:hypothetical protein